MIEVWNIQLNISDVESGLELSSLKCYIINRLAFHLQYGSSKYFLSLWFTCSAICVEYSVLGSEAGSKAALRRLPWPLRFRCPLAETGGRECKSGFRID